MDVFYAMAEGIACQPSEASKAANKLFAPVPATFSGSGFRFSLGCGGDKQIGPLLGKGRYRMHCPVSRTDNFLEIEQDATEDDEPIVLQLNVSDVVCRTPICQRKTLRATHGKLHIDTFTNTRSFFVLWIQDDLDDNVLLYLPENERKPYTNAVQLLSHETYQYLFSDECGESLANCIARMEKVSAQQQGRKRKAPSDSPIA